MTDLDGFPDIEMGVAAVLTPLGGHVGTETPAKLATRLPFTRVGVFGGSDDTVTDSTFIAVDTFAATKAAAAALAEQQRQHLTSGPHVIANGVLDRARTLTKPHQVPWNDSDTVIRYTASYRVSARRSADS